MLNKRSESWSKYIRYDVYLEYFRGKVQAYSSVTKDKKKPKCHSPFYMQNKTDW